ncbi:uncharacterized protein LOC107981061 [Nasonia vitripennis]|uniref:Uncharacterized protein n=1 Tax=Nasonia vitripennis TaxID=7425 RepID=A0A7M7IR89_NASVI|nr:uncharacterized protein LOC107981061 [Nasonia vitripennis]
MTREAEKSEASAIVSSLHEHHSPEAVIIKGFFAKNQARITDAEIQLMDESWEKFVSEAPSLVTIHKASNQIVGAIVLMPVENSHGSGSGQQVSASQEDHEASEHGSSQGSQGQEISQTAKKAALGSGFSKVMDYDMHSVKDTDGSCAFADLSPNNVTSIMALEIR